MRQYLPELMPLVVDALLDGGSVSKREVAVATLGQVIQSTGYMPFLSSHICVHIELHVSNSQHDINSVSQDFRC